MAADVPSVQLRYITHELKEQILNRLRQGTIHDPQSYSPARKASEEIELSHPHRQH
jgi:hypothetical protein